jgi:rubredoxin
MTMRTLNRPWVCTICGYRYDPDHGDCHEGVPPNIAFERLPPDWRCPQCGAGGDQFTPSELGTCHSVPGSRSRLSAS